MLQYRINNDCVLVENEPDKEDKYVREYKMHVKSMLMMTTIKAIDCEEEKGAENNEKNGADERFLC
jgi:hypothetical protein